MGGILDLACLAVGSLLKLGEISGVFLLLSAVCVGVGVVVLGEVVLTTPAVLEMVPVALAWV